MGGNRYGTQTNNIESVEVLKGPSSVLYGRGAVGGAINIVRKKPQAVRAYDFSYRGGRFNTHQVAGGATGPIGNSSRLLYRAGRQLRGQRRLARCGRGPVQRLAVADLDHERPRAPDAPPDVQPRPLRRRRRRAAQHHRPSELQARAPLQPAAGPRPGRGLADAGRCSTATSRRRGSSATRFLGAAHERSAIS